MSPTPENDRCPSEEEVSADRLALKSLQLAFEPSNDTTRSKLNVMHACGLAKGRADGVAELRENQRKIRHWKIATIAAACLCVFIPSPIASLVTIRSHSNPESTVMIRNPGSDPAAITLERASRLIEQMAHSQRSTDNPPTFTPILVDQFLNNPLTMRDDHLSRRSSDNSVGPLNRSEPNGTPRPPEIRRRVLRPLDRRPGAYEI